MSEMIAREIKQTKPFRSHAQAVGIGLRRTADMMGRRFVPVVASEGLTPQQYNVLRILRGAGQEGLPTMEIGERMIEETPGLTRLIDRLERAGQVRRERCTSDRRQVFCLITPDGLAALARLDPQVNAYDEAMLAMLSPAELDTLEDLLNRIRKGLGSTVQ